jgi:hypothetical protein
VIRRTNFPGDVEMQTLLMDEVVGASLTDRVFEIIAHAPGCQIKDVAHFLPDVSPREVFNVVRYLSDNGQLKLKCKQEGVTLTLSPCSFN